MLSLLGGPNNDSLCILVDAVVGGIDRVSKMVEQIVDLMCCVGSTVGGLNTLETDSLESFPVAQ